MLLQAQMLPGGRTPVEVTHVLTPTVFGIVYSAAIIDGSGGAVAYARAREGTGGYVGGDATSNAGQVGQRFVNGDTYECRELFFEFDTSGVVGTIQSASLDVYVLADNSTTAWTIEARLRDFGSFDPASEFVAGSALGGLTLLASAAHTVGTGWYPLASEAALVSNINQAGATRMVVNSSRHRVGNQPSTTEYLSIGNKPSFQPGRLTIVALD